MQYPKDFLDTYVSMQNCDDVAIEQAMMGFVNSTKEVQIWRMRCAMWVGESSLTGSFGVAVELYRKETFDSVQSFANRLLVETIAVHPHNARIARVIFGFDSRVTKIKTIREVYEYFCQNPKLTAKELCKWGNHKSGSDIRDLVRLCKSCQYTTEVWQLWNDGFADGDDAGAMRQRFIKAGFSKLAANRVVRLCMAIQNVKLDKPSIHDHVERTVSVTPGLTVTDYVKLGVKAGYTAKAYQTSIVAYMRMYRNVINDVTSSSEAIGVVARQLTTEELTDKWVDQMVLKGCGLSAVYQWRKKH